MCVCVCVSADLKELCLESEVSEVGTCSRGSVLEKNTGWGNYDGVAFLNFLNS